jgi:molecular chaperone GrpE
MPEEENEKNKETPSYSVSDRRHWASETEITDAPSPERLPTVVEKLKEEAEEKDRRLREYIAAYKAKTAETDEFRQRLQKENDSRLDMAKAGFFSKLVPILDNLKRAATVGKDNRDFDSLHHGIELIVNQFTRELQEQGVETLSARGRKFNPSTDEIFLTETTSDPEQDNMVVEDLEPGYKFREKLIKPVKVKVAKLKD